MITSVVTMKLYSTEGNDMRIWNYEEEGINIRDGVRGTVIGGCSKGIFLSLEDGQEAFAHFGGLNPGTIVLCTVLKKATEKWKVLVSLSLIHI